MPVGPDTHSRGRRPRELDTSVLKRAADAVGHALSQTDYEDWRRRHEPDAPSFRTFVRRFETWTAALQAAGVSDRHSTPRTWSDRELQDAAKAAAAELGEPLLMSGYQDWRARQSDPSRWPPARSFRDWVATCEAAGVTPAQYQLGYQRRYTDEEMLQFVRTANRGEPVSPRGYERWRERRRATKGRRRSIPSSAALILRFGSWSATLEAAGIASVTERWSDTQVRDALRRAVRDCGTDLTPSRYRDWARITPGVPSLSTVRRRVEDFQAAVADAARQL